MSMSAQMSCQFAPEAPMSAVSAQTARANLLRLINGFQASQAIHVAATLRLADLMRSGPESACDLASATSTNPVALHRLLRALASVGVFEERDGGRFALTPMGEFLRSDVMGTHAAMAELVGRKYFWDSWGDLLHAVRAGTTAFEHTHGRSVWEYRAQNHEECLIFDRAMARGTERYADAVIDVCDFGRF